MPHEHTHDRPPLANYSLSISSDSGYQSTTTGRCTAEQYTLVMRVLHHPVDAAACLNAPGTLVKQRDALLEAAKRLQARRWFEPHSCADPETTNDMAAMRDAIALAEIGGLAMESTHVQPEQPL